MAYSNATLVNKRACAENLIQSSACEGSNEIDGMELIYNRFYDSPSANAIVYLTIGITHFMGPMLSFGIIMYESYGGDPQKRNIMNQLLSRTLINFSIGSILMGLCRLWGNVFGPANLEVASCIFAAIEVMSIAGILFFNQQTIFRYLYIVVWKRMRVVEDEFWIHFLTILNYMIVIPLGCLRKLFQVNKQPKRLGRMMRIFPPSYFATSSEDGQR